METNDISLPATDTQKLYFSGYWYSMKEKNRREFVKLMKKSGKPNSGVYGIFHQRWGRESCLYVGASVRLTQRVSRIFTPKGNVENIYLYYLLKGLQDDGNYDRVNVQFYFAKDTHNLGYYEKFFVEKYRPFFNLNPTYHKIYPKR